MRRVGLLLLLGMVGFWLVRDVQARPVAHPPGVLAPDAPFQAPIANLQEVKLQKLGYQFQPQAYFELQARVLSRRLYRYDAASKLSPLDLALGWGRMSDTAVLRKLNIRQSDRWYYYSWPSEPPIPPGEIVVNSANMHMIPANAEIEQRLKRIKAGNVVRIKGFLVNVIGSNGFYWNTSLRRDDAGNGACEIVWVAELSIQ